MSPCSLQQAAEAHRSKRRPFSYVADAQCPSLPGCQTVAHTEQPALRAAAQPMLHCSPSTPGDSESPGPTRRRLTGPRRRLGDIGRCLGPVRMQQDRCVAGISVPGSQRRCCPEFAQKYVYGMTGKFWNEKKPDIRKSASRSCGMERRFGLVRLRTGTRGVACWLRSRHHYVS